MTSCLRHSSNISGSFCLLITPQSNSRAFWLLHFWPELYTAIDWFWVSWKFGLTILIGSVVVHCLHSLQETACYFRWHHRLLIFVNYFFLWYMPLFFFFFNKFFSFFFIVIICFPNLGCFCDQMKTCSDKSFMNNLKIDASVDSESSLLYYQFKLFFNLTVCFFPVCLTFFLKLYRQFYAEIHSLVTFLFSRI